MLKKLSSMPYAQARVEITDSGAICLYSYKTLVAAITNDGWLCIFGLYSATTRRHIGAFMKEYVVYPNGSRGSYQDAKRLYTDHINLNILTGEIEES